MTERRIVSKPARAARSLRFQQAVVLAACAASAALGLQACGSDGGSGGGGGATPGGGAGPGAGAGGTANPGGGAGGMANPGAGASNAGTGGSAPTAGAGNAGAAGAGTAGAGGGSGGAAPNIGDSVLERNNHASRDGLFVQPKLTKAAIPMLTADTAFEKQDADPAKANSTGGHFSGNMWASPLYLANGPGGKGAYFAVTTGNDVIAIDETTGVTVWKKNIGSAPTANGVSCGDIHPLGILSTPVIDAASRTIYVAGAIGTNAIDHHEVHALNIEDGTEKAGWPVSTAGLKSGNLMFNQPAQNQRSALSLVGGKVYVAYGGHVGDCNIYHGWVLAIDTTDPTKKGAWATLGQGEAIWAAGGMASDGTSIFAVTGNSTNGVGDRANSDSEQVVRLSGLATFTRNNNNLFFPTAWQAMDSTDADFGSSNPIYLTVPGATPPNYVAAVAKDGQLYLLNASNLGGMAGAVLTVPVAPGEKPTDHPMNVRTSPTSFTDAKGTHFVLSTEGGAACPGGGGGHSILSVLIKAGSPPTATSEWCAPLNGTTTAPITTMTNGTDNAAVWYVNNNKLTAVDGDTGAKLYESADSCNGARKWTSPIAANGHIVVGGDGHLCSWSAK